MNSDFPFELNPCQGCSSFDLYKGDPVCMNLVHWNGPVPDNPPCHSEYTGEDVADT